MPRNFLISAIAATEAHIASLQAQLAACHDPAQAAQIQQAIAANQQLLAGYHAQLNQFRN